MTGAEPAPETLCFYNLRRWTKSKIVFLSSIIHHRQNPLEGKKIFYSSQYLSTRNRPASWGPLNDGRKKEAIEISASVLFPPNPSSKPNLFLVTRSQAPIHTSQRPETLNPAIMQAAHPVNRRRVLRSRAVILNTYCNLLKYMCKNVIRPLFSYFIF
jgi:hypothetical protein